MSCEHLICARCSGPVSEARCPACQASRAHVHHQAGPGLAVPLVALVLLLTLMMMLALHLVP